MRESMGLYRGIVEEDHPQKGKFAKGHLWVTEEGLAYILTWQGDIECGRLISEAFKVDPATVGQYTGLKDKKGVKIFEGDVVKISEVLEALDFITDIYFDDSGFRYRHADGSGSILPRHTKKVKGYEGVTVDMEVIGNIHSDGHLLDKPELLETK